MTGSLLYVVIGTRPDIPQAVGAVTKYNANPNNAHLTAGQENILLLKRNN